MTDQLRRPVTAREEFEALVEEHGIESYVELPHAAYVAEMERAYQLGRMSALEDLRAKQEQDRKEETHDRDAGTA